MLGYILCEKGMIYKGIKYKENGVYFRVDGFIVFLNLESLITNMWNEMNQDSQIVMVEGIPCNHKATNKIPIKVGILKFLREINYSRYKIKDFNCAMFLKILKTDKNKIEEKIYIDELEYDEYNDSLLLYAMAKSGNPKAINNLITFIKRNNEVSYEVIEAIAENATKEQIKYLAKIAYPNFMAVVRRMSFKQLDDFLWDTSIPRDRKFAVIETGIDKYLDIFVDSKDKEVKKQIIRFSRSKDLDYFINDEDEYVLLEVMRFQREKDIKILSENSNQALASIAKDIINGKIFLVTQEDDIQTYEEEKSDIYYL